jgi:pyrroline-5-carboxylate reductase
MKIAIIGCGVIGSAFARHCAKNNSLFLCDRTFAKSSTLAQEIGAIAVERPADAIEKADVIILAIKPKDFQKFAEETSPLFKPEHIVVSALAGTPLATLLRYFQHSQVIRCLPNLPMLCGEGVLGFTTLQETPTIKETIHRLFQELGLLIWLSEEKLEGLSALAGSGPAFIYVIIEAMIDSGVLLGFPEQEAKELAIKTLEGSIRLLRESGTCPAELKLKVASPGGTTIAGLKVLEEEGVRGALMRTYQATYQKALTMSKEIGNS